jgi:hypothetical protein
MVEGHVFLWTCGFESRSGHKAVLKGAAFLFSSILPYYN